MRFILTLVAIMACSICYTQSNSIHQFTMTSLTGEKIRLEDYKGKIVLIVNTASKCGLTPQYEELEKLYQQYKDKGFTILGFPANNFLKQEPGSNEEIAEFCKKNYGVSFPMFSKISVRGDDIHPLYAFLTNRELNGKVDGKIKWNFQKFLINQNGEVVASFSPKTLPFSEEIQSHINSLIN